MAGGQDEHLLLVCGMIIYTTIYQYCKCVNLAHSQIPLVLVFFFRQSRNLCTLCAGR